MLDLPKLGELQILPSLEYSKAEAVNFSQPHNRFSQKVRNRPFNDVAPELLLKETKDKHFIETW